MVGPPRGTQGLFGTDWGSDQTRFVKVLRKRVKVLAMTSEKDKHRSVIELTMHWPPNYVVMDKLGTADLAHLRLMFKGQDEHLNATLQFRLWLMLAI